MANDMFKILTHFYHALLMKNKRKTFDKSALFQVTKNGTLSAKI